MEKPAIEGGKPSRPNFLPYGTQWLDDKEINNIRSELNSKSQDAFILIMGEQKEVEKAIKVINEKGTKMAPAPEGAELQRFYDLHDEVANALKGDVFPVELLNKVHNILKKMRTTK